ncbi:MAG: exonuclease subunit SbcD, partial [Acidimicrobiia bacterium]
MRILHTSDWHLCKPLHRRDRTPEYRAVLDEVVEVADREAVDLDVHSGDLFDRAIPAPEALSLGLDALVRLAAGGRRPAVVVAGNHDSPKLFEALAPVLAPLGVHLVGDLRAPAAGGVVEVETASGSALVSAV